ncbi:hypothetical protein V500_02532 [Pseudogymnoascus sp. VKM F-4518 (FW-2643)]|nr:hypothetical protein V500_02532 [Pseudogymnoascus sp. VKM F-4518 (FW-2643)]
MQLTIFERLHKRWPGNVTITTSKFIVAVHGLNPTNTEFHAQETWTATISQKLWLRDFLPQQIPRARVLLFGYNANVAFQSSKAGVGQQAANLLNRLTLKRKALVEARLDKTYEPILRATYGIAFFATPHRGGNYAKLGDIAASIASACLRHQNNNFMKSLTKDSLFGAELSRNFRHVIDDFFVLSFCETLTYKKIGLIVDEQSATLGLSGVRERQISMAADHVSICKFESETDDDYEQVIGNLLYLVEGALEAVEQRALRMDPSVPLASLQLKESPAYPPKPLKILPFGRNRDFVGRQSQLNQLITILHTEDIEEDCQRVALFGLGGVGKTQIALECAFQLQSTSPMCSVFWVRASDATSFDNAYRNIGQQLKIPGLDNEKADVKRLVKAQLSQENSGKWLMIVDNADDFEMFYNGSDDNGSGALSEYLPFSTLGSILFTTRNREAATRYAGSNVIDVSEMDDSESRELLQRSLQNKQLIEDKDSITTLLKSLVNLPLAIMQAVAYLNAKGSTIAEYLRIYEESSDNVIKLLSKDFEDTTRYPGMKNPIATTWLISFKQIQVRDPLAAEYMAFISCVSEEDIPRDLLPPASEYDKIEALGTLKAFGFIKERFSAASYDMHRLVHIAMQNWLKLKDEWRSWNEKTLNRITDTFPWPQHENREVWMMYLPHAKCAITAFKSSFGGTRNLPWNLLHNLGESSRITGKYAEAEAMDRQTVQLQEAVLGKNHPVTLTCMNNLAASLELQGKYAEAEAMHRQTLQLQETVLGKHHPDTLASMVGIAASLQLQGKYAEAEAMHRQTLQLQETVLGKDHPDTLTCMNNLAASLYAQGKYAEAEAMHRQTLQLKETVLGKDHPSTLTSVSNLAASLQLQGKYAEAEAMHRQTSPQTSV